MSEERPVYYTPPVPDADAILSSPDTSTWLKDALRAALERDPVDAANDAELLCSVLAGRCAAALSRF